MIAQYVPYEPWIGGPLTHLKCNRCESVVMVKGTPSNVRRDASRAGWRCDITPTSVTDVCGVCVELEESLEGARFAAWAEECRRRYEARTDAGNEFVAALRTFAPDDPELRRSLERFDALQSAWLAAVRILNALRGGAAR